MEQAKKHLKISSLIVLLFAGLSLLNIVVELLLGDINSAEIPEGAPVDILMITKIILLVVSVICLFPRVYVGMKGLRMAKNPDSSKGHIIWATIIFVLTLIGLVSPLFAVVKQENVSENVSSLLGILLDLAIYYDYIKYAKQVSKQASEEN